DRLERPLLHGVRDDQTRPDVELDEVAAEVDSGGESLERVLGRERGRTAVADHERRPPVAAQVHARLTTTTAQSSASSPPPNARQSARTACASSCAVSATRAASSASRRSTPYSSPPLRPASITPSV